MNIEGLMNGKSEWNNFAKYGYWERKDTSGIVKFVDGKYEGWYFRLRRNEPSFIGFFDEVGEAKIAVDNKVTNH